MVTSARADHPRDGAVPRALLINGTVGVGKTTVAAAVSHLLVQGGVPNALIDVDALRQAWPAPPDDRFTMRLALRNLTSVAANCVEAGMTHLVLAGVVETPRDRQALEAALGMPLTICRLLADPAAVRDRLVSRHLDDEGALSWHLDRARELDAILDSNAVSEYSVDATNTTPPELAIAVTRATGWRSSRHTRVGSLEGGAARPDRGS